MKMKKFLDFYPPLNLDEVFVKKKNATIYAKENSSEQQGMLAKNKSFSSILQQINVNTQLNAGNGLSSEKLTNMRNSYLRNSTDNMKKYDANAANKFDFKLLKEIEEHPIKYFRKLGPLEKIFHGDNPKSRCYIYRTLLISSEIDFYKNINLVKKAIAEWRNMNALLRCCVANKQSENSTLKDDYFAQVPDDKLNSLDNVKFLYYTSKLDQSFDEIWKLIVEKEKLDSITDDSLLWRLTFFQIKSLPEFFNGNYHYTLTLTYDHSIMDGRSSYNSLLQLLTIIENMYVFNHTSEPADTTILPSKEEIFKQRPKLVLDQILKNCFIKTPEFLDVKNAIKSSYIRLKYLSAEEEEHGCIYTHEHQPFVRVKELTEISQKNNSKFRTLLINQQDLEKILKKCKQNETKLTSFINMVIILALRLVYLKYGDEEAKNDPINFTVNVSLRETEEFKDLKPSALGCYVGLYFNSFKEKFNLNDNTWKKELWTYASQESKAFHARLSNGQFIQPVVLATPRAKNEFFYHFANSNIGVVKACMTEKRLIRIKQSFTTSRYNPENNFCWFTNLIATINNQLCWSISFNSYYIKQEYISLIIANISKIIKKILTD